MLKKTYTLEFKICIIKELIKQTKKQQELNEENQDYNDNIWAWQHAESCAYLTVLNILDDDLDCITEKTLLNANKLLEDNSGGK